MIRTRIREGADAIPPWALEYLADITMDDDGEWAWESTAAFGWAVGHPAVAVLDRALERTERDDEPWAMGVLKHVTFADPDRLRRFDDSYRFDLERAAAEYGQPADE